MRPIIIITAAITAALSLASCNDYTKLQKSADYGYKYEVAKQYYAQGQFNRANLFLQDVYTMMKGTDKGEESLFLLAMSNFRARSYDAAVAYFKKYYQTYPKGIYTEKAHYFCALALYNNTPEVKLDQTETFEAVTEFQTYLELYPASERAERVQAYIFALQDKLVEKEYLSAKLYFDLGSYFGNCANGGSNYQACIVTAENAIKDFPYTQRREDLAMLVLKAKFDLAAQSVDTKKEERYHDAIDEYYGFTNEYPESKYTKEAQQLFKKASRYVQAGGDEGTTDDTGTPADSIK